MKRYCIDFLGEYECFFFCKYFAVKAAKTCAVRVKRPIAVYKWARKNRQWKTIKDISRNIK